MKFSRVPDVGVKLLCVCRTVGEADGSSDGEFHALLFIYLSLDESWSRLHSE